MIRIDILEERLHVRHEFVFRDRAVRVWIGGLEVFFRNLAAKFFRIQRSVRVFFKG